MASRRTSRPGSSRSGFTAIEVLVVLGLFAMVAVLGFGTDLNTYARALSRSDEDALLSALWHARSESVSSVCSAPGCTPTPHGVRVSATQIVVFEGTSYDSRVAAYDEPTERTGTDVVTADFDPVFLPYSGYAATGSDIELSAPNKPAQTIRIGAYGGIDIAL